MAPLVHAGCPHNTDEKKSMMQLWAMLCTARHQSPVSRLKHFGVCLSLCHIMLQTMTSTYKASTLANIKLCPGAGCIKRLCWYDA